VTLRARLTAAFLVVVLGPVLLGAVLVAGTVTAVHRDRSVERLDLAASAIRTSIGALCRQLRTVAQSIAVVQGAVEPPAVADRAVAQGLASAVRVVPAGGAPVTTAAAPAEPWAYCAGTSADAGTTRYTAIAAGVELRDATGAWLGTVYAAQRLDLLLLLRLADASDAAVTLLGGSQAPLTAALSTEPSDHTAAVVGVAGPLTTGEVGEVTEGRYVRRDGPGPDQPLPLALSVPSANPSGLYAVLVAVVVLAAVLAVGAAWWLARSTTRPLAELARVVDRVAGGDLAARVPVRRPDEVGRLGTTFNRMTREMQSYVHALTASRDQLRGHLGVLGDTLSSTHDLGRILEVLLQTALAATGARAGIVLLADPAGGELVGQYAEGLEERWPSGVDSGAGAKAIRVPIGTGLLGGVAASRIARRGRVDRDGPVIAPAEPRCRTYVAVPFTAPGRRRPVTPAPANRGAWPAGLPPASGVLALYDRLGGDEFDDADLVTLRTFAGQAAVAVDNVRVHEEAQRLSVTDPLTGLLNYRSLRESLRREVERATRFGRMLGVLALDLDRFKEVNDSYGHAAGDAVLAEFARRIRREIREVDLAFRQGGEEFVLLLPETDVLGAIVVAERLGTVVRAAPMSITASHRQLSLTITVSIGIAVYPDQPGGEVLQAADDALYAAKAAGRDTYRLAGQREPDDERRTPARAHAPVAPTQSGDDSAAQAAPGGEPVPGAGGVAGGPHPPRQTRGG